MYHKLILFLLLTGFTLHGQHNPVVTYYASSEYKAHQQNWHVLPSPGGDVYAANTSGLLHGNGNSWTLYSLASNKIIRSLCIHDDELYTGSFGETGVWKKDACGKLNYVNLTGKIEEKNFRNEEVWHMVSDGENLFLQSFSLLLTYKNNRFTRIPTQGTILFLQIVEGKKLIPVLESGIFELRDDNQMVLLPGSDFFKNKVVTGIVPYSQSGTYLITTNDHGVFVYENARIRPWVPALQPLFKEGQINKSLRIKNGLYLMGSINAGLYVLTEEGRLVYHFHAGNGLYNNTVLSLTENEKGDVWVGLDKGLALLQFSKTDEIFQDAYGHFGSVYSVKEHAGSIYMATNQGVYKYTRNNAVKFATFRLVPGTQGQSWQLFTIHDNLYCGHNDGTLAIENDRGKSISSVTGGWMNEPIPGSGENLWLQGNYTGMALFEQQNGQLTYRHKVEGFTYPVKKFVIFNKHIWVTGPNQGLYKLLPDTGFKNILKVEKYEKNKGVKNSENIDLYVFRDTLRVFNGKQHFYYEPSTDQFKEDSFFSALEGSFMVRALEKDFWLQIFQDKVVLMKDDTAIKHIPKTMTKDYHNVSSNKDGRYILCLEEGYYVLSLPGGRQNTLLPPEKINVVITGQHGDCHAGDEGTLGSGSRSFIAAFYDCQFTKNKQYLYRILPLHTDWKPTHTASSVQIENLNPGKYTLEIRRNDGISATTPIIVKPPWYAGWPAIFAYTFLGIGLIVYIKRYYENQLTKASAKYTAEQERLKKQHETELENQKLHHENQLKNREIANTALQLVQKNEILQDIKNELIEIRKSSTHTLTAKDFQILMKQINENLTVQEDKNLFDTSFEEMHEKFLTVLKNHFPNLTRDDLRLAAYLRMEMPTKEIAPLFNLSVRGLENKRYRLRKKLGLSAEDNISTFFKQLQDL